ncbi:hypothetical protein HB4184_19605 [Pseudomonas putida]|nr:hypothetical protein HB4184_19605 [Pseudomonas putida]
MGTVTFPIAIPALKRQRVAFPHVPGEPAAQFLIALPPGILIPHRPGLGPVAVFGAGVFVQPAPQRIVVKASSQPVIFVPPQAVEEVPDKVGALAVLASLQQVAAFVVSVLRAAIAAQHVVVQPSRRVWIGTGRGLWVQQVAGRVEGEQLLLAAVACFQQAAERVALPVRVLALGSV